ncbi:AAA family ATPase, partial [Streptomyces sp.]|uniref:AAA family ATPase n=1 Tax=Streptomyces sp. TaxID=1931 RepID=UPI002F4031BC
MEQIVGRRSELAVLDRLLADKHGGRRLVLLAGGPGSGKTVLLEAAVATAERQGLRVLRLRGSQADTGLSFAGLRQLLLPLLSDAGADDAGGDPDAGPGTDVPAATTDAGSATDPAAADSGATTATGPTPAAGSAATTGSGAPAPALTAHQRASLLGALGLGEAPGAGTLPVLVGALSLVTGAAAERPVLLAVDDLQWLDHESLNALAFILRRLGDEAVVAVATARAAELPEQFVRDFPRIDLAPLTETEAGELLDRQSAVPPTGHARTQILRAAEGNPLALVELARTAGRARTPRSHL